MLIQYSTDYEKITMGLFSYVLDLKKPSRIEEELNWYNSKENREIYLWQSQETQNLVGMVGIEKTEDAIIIRHLAIDPSYRNEGITYKILDSLEAKYSEQNIVSTLETASLISKWQKRKLDKN